MEKVKRNSINKKQNGLKYSKNDKSSTLQRKPINYNNNKFQWTCVCKHGLLLLILTLAP